MKRHLWSLILLLMLCNLLASSENMQHWAFQPLSRRDLPNDPNLSPIDSLIQQKLHDKGIRPNSMAEPRDLLRRAYFDLLGLPPTPEQLQSFLNDTSQNRWEKLIDHLLAQAQFGERLARKWLDLVRYAETNGYERDGNKPEAWRYRDYVIDSFNQNKPYDQFVLEQLAGDLLPDYSDEALIATGFYRLHVWDDEPDNTLEAEYDELDDIMVTLSGTFLGLTLGCARCHDHKFDDFSQKEYYQLLAYFRNIDPYGKPHSGGGGRGVGQITRYLASPQELQNWYQQHDRKLSTLQQQIVSAPDESTRTPLAQQLETLKKQAPPFPQALAIADSAEVKPTFLLHRGRPESPRDPVSPTFPQVLATQTRATPSTTSVPPRLALAQWITSSGNPLTARIMANRVWGNLFGTPLVETPSDFGQAGLPPNHTELLDHLALYLQNNQWSLKALYKHLLLSQTYQRSSSTLLQPNSQAIDPTNNLLWRQNLRRLDAESLRDSMLHYSGQLNLKMHGPSVYPQIPETVHKTQDSARKGWGESPIEEQNRRSIYLFAKRSIPLPFLEVFDAAPMTFPIPQRPITTTAPQSLTLLNDPFIHQQARHLAELLRHQQPNQPSEQIQLAFQRVLQRTPNPQELEETSAIVQRQTQRLIQSSSPPLEPDLEALQFLCVALFNLSETLYIP